MFGSENLARQWTNRCCYVRGINVNVTKITHTVWGGFLVMCMVITCGGALMAQPLVTGDLSVYYSFDDFVDEVPDESGNELPLDGVVYGIVGKVDDAVRGDGSAFIFSEPFFDPEHFIAIGGCDQFEDLDACEAIPEDRIPSTGFTVATWAKLQSTGGDQSIFQAMSGDGSFVVHAQAQNSQELRIHLRGQLQSENINGFVGGIWPEEEWFHYAVTYDQPNNVWALYFNGQPIAGGPAEGNAGNVPLGDWGRGALIGIVPDRNRQAFGQFDEYYIFTRAITSEEVEILFDLVEPVTCDFNGDGFCDTVDLDDLGTEIIAGNHNSEFDLTGEGLVNLSDQVIWLDIAAANNGFAEPYLDGDADLDGAVIVGDLNVVGTNWQSSSDINPWTHGDFNADGMTEVADLNLLALNWQDQIAAAASDAEAVPEPSAVALLLLAALAGLYVGRRS